MYISCQNTFQKISEIGTSILIPLLWLITAQSMKVPVCHLIVWFFREKMTIPIDIITKPSPDEEVLTAPEYANQLQSKLRESHRRARNHKESSRTAKEAI